MRYSYEYKRKCVELFREGKWPETPNGIKDKKNFYAMIRRWVRIEDANGPEALKHKNFNKIWTPEQKLELVSKVLAGNSIQEIAFSVGCNASTLSQWVQKYKTKGYNGLVDMKKGRASKEPDMHKMELKGKRPKEKFHSYKGDVGKVAENLIDRDFSTKAPLEKWTTDVSQFSFSWGKCYLSPILDMNTNEIISYDLSPSPNLEQVKRMLETAFQSFPDLKGLILHSDQGWQYQHAYFRNELKEHGIIQSMSRKGNCYDNCIMETFFGRMKNEMFYGNEKAYRSFEEFQRAVNEYIDYYNNERIQAKTKWMPLLNIGWHPCVEPWL